MPITAPLLKSLERWNRFALDNATMLLGAGEVIGHRSARMARHGLAPDLAERREMRRMVEEKQAALLEGSLAAWSTWMRLGQDQWLEAVRLTTRNGVALWPAMVGLNPGNALSRSRRFATGATARSMASATRLRDGHLQIADAAFEPVRARVAANRKRLST